MPDRKKVDAYIAKAAEFARPILARLREAFHAACPEIEERLKWGMPSFERNGIVGGMAAFKKHTTFGFWRQNDLEDPDGVMKGKMSGSTLRRAESLDDLPSMRALIDYIQRAVALNIAGTPATTKAAKKSKKAKRAPLPMPDDFAAALKKSKAAKAAFEKFPPSHQREYIEWIVEAKRPETRTKRLAQAIEMIAEGKSRNWKYQPKKT
jgi:uncharacterized protein YdeI (YjbR/CyaY-like superfamily)